MNEKNQVKLDAPKGEIQLSKVKKLELKEFVTKIVDERRKEFEEALRLRIEVQMLPHAETYLKRNNAERIEKLANEIEPLFAPIANDLGNQYYSFAQAYTDLRYYMIKLQKSVLTYVRDEMYKALLDPHKERWFKFSWLGSEAKVTYDEAVQYAIENKKKRGALDVLENELHQAINNESTGKRAYEALVALGVDMTNFEPEYLQARNLPAVVKLSADVCLLNKTC